MIYCSTHTSKVYTIHCIYYACTEQGWSNDFGNRGGAGAYGWYFDVHHLIINNIKKYYGHQILNIDHHWHRDVIILWSFEKLYLRWFAMYLIYLVEFWKTNFLFFEIAISNKIFLTNYQKVLIIINNSVFFFI